MRGLRHLAVGAVGVLGLYLGAALLGALVPAGPDPDDSPAATRGPEVTIGLIGGPIHYDFVLPMTSETRQAFAPLAAAGVPVDAPELAWMVVGWGSEAFYTTVGTWRDVSAAALFRAVTGDASVLRVGLYGPVDWGARWREVRVSGPEYARLLAAIRGNFATRPGSAPGLVAGPKPGRSGWFFAAEGRFNALRTCNTWVGTMLRAAGQRFGIWTPTPYAVRLSHVLHLR
ncbi:TIGR02117 family protein [Dinoroseobacter sp. PD6]|uniref:TIGR02117 family protein n=1 Tax=Dinoroseobacter sp. PD6 TaxID=3028384 RepID=UPI00237B5F56|nr:TIGR02117 family protein [Dinoroseobacter sp. PD6]MDD9716913.1 TIGR02117 family protein [Dinoroseobacter sp. PD6]